MTYTRVIPRDLFNEAKILKCLGQLYLNLERFTVDRDILLDYDGGAFDIRQNPASGGLRVWNVDLIVRGRYLDMESPLNSREPYPLFIDMEGDDEDIKIFNDDGSFSAEMIEFLG